MGRPTYAILVACQAAALGEGECVHVREDGTVTTGTDGQSTVASDWGDVEWTWHSERRPDPWDCFRFVGRAEKPERR